MFKKEELAINGGPKTVKSGRFKWPKIDKNIEKSVISQLHESISIYDRSGIFKEFEDSFASYHNRDYALLCSSGTLAIKSMFIVAGLKEGDEVICPAYTFFATVTPLLHTGARPVLCDSDENGNIDPKEVEKKITKNTKAVIVTHMWGIPCEMDKIVKICKNNNILLMEDCSHAHGSRYKNRVVGSFGDLAAWSLQGSKNITGGEGGIMITDNKDFYYKALLLGHYNKRCRQEIDKDNPYSKYAKTGMGLKYRAHPLAVRIAFELFKKIDETKEIKKEFAEVLINKLKKFNSIKLPPAFLRDDIEPSWYALPFLCCSEKFSREEIFNALQAEGLEEMDMPGSTCPINLFPLFNNPTELFPSYSKKENYFSYKKGDFPKAEEFHKKIIKTSIGSYKFEKKLVGLYAKGIEKVFNFFD